MGEKEAVTANCSLTDLLDQVDTNIFVLLIPTLTNYFTLRADCFKAHHEKGDFISPIPIRPKKDGPFRLILNLK